MLVKHDRPRDLRWYHAGPLLFGDLGTSRLYTLGLAVFYAGLAAPLYVAAIGVLLIVVGWAYTVVCRVNPDGGGVYSSGRLIHPTLGAVGAILLMSNYVVTAAISTYEAIIYIGAPLGMAREMAPTFTILAIAVIGALNYVGPRQAGKFALGVALAAVGITFVLALITLPHLPEGWRTFRDHAPRDLPLARMWQNLVFVVLALSGVESVANMTGIMKPPVERTAKRAIWPVVLEVVAFNLILILVVCSLHGYRGTDIGVIADKDPTQIVQRELELTEHVLEVVAREYVHPTFAVLASLVFGLLLLSATNTAIIAMISIQYAMSRDREMPETFARLNSFGVPVFGLVTACALAAGVTGICANLGAGTLQTLAKFYAIGVVGAIVINLGSCAVNLNLIIRWWERWSLATISGLLLAIWLTIAFTNRPALIFITVMLAFGLALRFIARRVPVRVPVPVTAAGPAPVAVAEGELLPFDPAKPRLLVASRGRNLRLLQFAFDEARRREANIFVLFVRDLAVLFPGKAPPMTPEEDREASALFQHAESLARQYRVPLQPIYCVSRTPADAILDFSATYAVDVVMLGVSRRAAVLRALRGDVISGVADNLPAESTLLIHA